MIDDDTRRKIQTAINRGGAAFDTASDASVRDLANGLLSLARAVENVAAENARLRSELASRPRGFFRR